MTVKTVRVSNGRSDFGNGHPCPDNPDHGHMYVLPSGKSWCPHADHSGKNRKQKATA